MRKPLLVAAIFSLIALNICLAWQWFASTQEIKALREEISHTQKNQQIIVFTQLLTDTVLSGNREISFEDRLNLERTVRELNDQEIFNQWQKFTKSGNDIETQQNFTDLIKLLLLKVSSQENQKS